MRFFTSRQVVIVAVSSGLFAAGLVLGVGLFLIHGRLPGSRVETLDSVQPRVAPVNGAAGLNSSGPVSPRVQGPAVIPARTGEGYSEDELENIQIYEKLNAGVVNVTTETVAYNFFFDPVPQEGGTGSGSIIDRRGYVLTNNHVVDQAYKVFVTLADGSRFEGKVVGKDPENDIAIIKFDPHGEALVTVPFGTSADLKVGQKVLAIGNPFALERTLTTGIISGLGRPVRGSGGYIIKGMIQTDASINPGNSGGPLLNSHGEMIGINTMIYSPSGGSVGIGFATPIDTARRIVPELIANGSVRRGWIDINPVDLDQRLASYFNLPVSRGVLVSRVTPGGNAEAAGIHGGTQGSAVRYQRGIIYGDGDIITRINDTTIDSTVDLFSALENTKPGDKATVVVLRKGKEMTFHLTLSERPANVGLS